MIQKKNSFYRLISAYFKLLHNEGLNSFTFNVHFNVYFMANINDFKMAYNLATYLIMIYTCNVHDFKLYGDHML